MTEEEVKEVVNEVIERRCNKMTEEERKERRKIQLREAQQRYREAHRPVKPIITAEEKLRIKKEKAHQRYLKKKEEKIEIKERKPMSYTVEYLQEYHKNYYKQNKEKLLNRCKEYYYKNREAVKKTD